MRAKLAFQGEMAKQRVLRIAEVWSRLGESEAAMWELLRAVSRAQVDHGNDGDAFEAAMRELLPLEEASKRSTVLAQRTAGANRFWLDDAFYEDAESFHNVQMQMLEDFAHGNLASFEHNKAKMEEARRSILNVARDLL